MSLDRQDKALREFKQIMADLVLLLRTSSKAELAYMCWVNQERQQFVWETNSTELPNVMFQDRIHFEQHFLDNYKDITEVTKLKVGEDIAKGKLAHYLNYVNATCIVLIPFINKGETVAITVLESDNDIELRSVNKQVYAYNNAMVNVLDTYLEIVDLHEDQNEWKEYENTLHTLDHRLHRVTLLYKMMDEIQHLVPTARVSFIAPGMDCWSQVLSTDNSPGKPSLGLLLEQGSAAYEAVEKGEPVFSMHFNNSPKIVSTQEGLVEGASLCIPLLIHDRRQGVFVVHDTDALTFKESTKHKLINMVRVTALSIQSVVKKAGMAEELLVEDFGAFMPDLWEESVNRMIGQEHPGVENWFGLVTPDDISSLRTRFRLDDLQRLQTEFVRFLNPANHKLPGFVGYNSDYVYAIILQSNEEDAVERWMESVRTSSASSNSGSEGQSLTVNFQAGFVPVNNTSGNAYEVLNNAKKALNEVVKNDDTDLVIHI